MNATKHYGLLKPEKSEDSAAISSINGNMESIDSILNGISETIAIVQRTDTATQAIAKGSFVIWKGDLYTAKVNITLGDTLSDTNLTAFTGGGLNASTVAPLEVIDKTSGYYVEGRKYFTESVTFPASDLNGKKPISIVGYQTGSTSVTAYGIKLRISTQLPGTCYVDFDLRNLDYPSNVSGEKTLRALILVG